MPTSQQQRRPPIRALRESRGLTLRETARLAGDPPLFVAIADEFAAVYGDYEHIRLLPSCDNQTGRSLHPDVAAHFRQFHAERARLRIVARDVNGRLYRERAR